MVTPSDSPEQQVRCGMCGKPNPPNAEVCQHCGSRLNPATSSDDLSDSPLTGPPAEEDTPPTTDDLMDAIRAQFDNGDLHSSTESSRSSLPGPEMESSFGSSSSSDEDALPSFLSRHQSDEPSDDAEETPDWLSELEPPADEPKLDIEDALGWLSTADDRQKEPAQPSALADSIPDWLSEFDRTSQQPASPSQPTEGSADLPGWLSELTGTPDDQPAAGQPEPETGDLQWLADYSGDDEPDTLIVDTGTAEEESPGTAAMDMQEATRMPVEGPDKEPRPSAADDAVPDWLADVATDKGAGDETEAQPPDEAGQPPLSEGALPEPLIESAAPSWLIEQRADEAAEEAVAEAAAISDQQVEKPAGEAEQEPEPLSEEEPIPGWLAGLEDEKAGPSPDWMSDLTADTEPDAVGEPSALEPAEEADEVSAWMAELSTEAEPQPAGETVSETEPDAVSEIDMEGRDISLDWLDKLESEPEADADDAWLAALDFSDEPVAPVGEDLLGLSSDLTPMTEEPDETPTSGRDEEVARAVDFGDLPEWLQGMGEMAGIDLPESERPLAPSASVTSEELAEIQGLRYEALTGQDRDQRAEQTESVGALKDVRGVIQPELIFEGSTLTVTEPIQQVVVTQTQARKVELIQHLLERESETFTTPEVGTRLPIVRWVVALLMVLAVAGTLLTGTFILPAPESAPGVVSTHQAIDGMTAIDAVVLVAFEYEPDSAGEMDPLAEALLWHLAQKPNITVYTISTRPTGAAMADAILGRGGIQPRLAANGGTWRNLGYVSGQANGVSSLASGAASDVSSPFSFDVAGQPTGLSATSLAGASVDHLIVLAARPDDARMWIEQASQPTGIPLIAAVGASAAPLLRPYAGSGQIVGLLVGLNDAVAYWRLNGQQVGRALLSRYNAQAVGSLVATALILIGGIVSGILSLRNRKESLS